MRPPGDFYARSTTFYLLAGLTACPCVRFHAVGYFHKDLKGRRSPSLVHFGFGSNTGDVHLSKTTDLFMRRYNNAGYLRQDVF